MFKMSSISSEQGTEQVSSCNGQFFPTRITEFEFVTCDRPEDFVDFEAFLKPFDLRAWLLLGLIVIVSTGFLMIILKLEGQSENVLLLLCSFLVEHGYHIRSSVLKLSSFNVFLTVFLFMTIVLTNGYKGIVITDITAPLTGRQLISTFEEAVKRNYTLITPNPILRNQVFDFQRMNQYNETYMTDIWRMTYNSEYIFTDSVFYMSFTAALKHTTENFAVTHPLFKSIRKLMISWVERDLSLLFNGTDSEFLKCNKTILVDRSQELKITFAKLSHVVESDKSRSNVRLNKGNDGILTQIWGIYVSRQKWDNGLLAKRMSHLIASGIPNEFKEMEIFGLVKLQGLKEVKTRQPSRLNLNTNILTLFAVYAVGSSASIIWLSLECCVNIS